MTFSSLACAILKGEDAVLPVRILSALNSAWQKADAYNTFIKPQAVLAQPNSLCLPGAPGRWQGS